MKFKGMNKDLYSRRMTLDDVKYITFKGWAGKKGVFAWYYMFRVTHYLKIAEV